jgi:hypothetical protein
MMANLFLIPNVYSKLKSAFENVGVWLKDVG